MNSKKQYSLSFIFGLILFIILVPSFAGCSSQSGKLKTRDLAILRVDGSSIGISAEIAATEEERAQGLMYRRELPPGKGMLFVFDRDQVMNFWMKNTLIPLSIAYISSDGLILEIHHMKPHSEAPVRSGRSARYALEVPQGWFETENIKAGDRLLLENL